MYSGRTMANLEIKKKTLSQDAKRTSNLIRYKKREKGQTISPSTMRKSRYYALS